MERGAVESADLIVVACIRDHALGLRWIAIHRCEVHVHAFERPIPEQVRREGPVLEVGGSEEAHLARVGMHPKRHHPSLRGFMPEYFRVALGGIEALVGNHRTSVVVILPGHAAVRAVGHGLIVRAVVGIGEKRHQRFA